MSNLFKELFNPPKPTEETKTIDVIRSLSEAFVTVTQDISQGVITNQVASINCDKDANGEACLGCIKALKSVGFDTNYITESCKVSCTCSMENIDMSQIIKLDLDTKLSSVSAETFMKQFENSIVAQSKQEGSKFNYFSTAEIKTLTQSVTNIFSKMRSIDFKQKVDAINNLQLLTLKGAGTVKNITLKTAINFVSKCIMASENIMSEVTDIEKQIINMSSQITKNFILALIDLFVYAIMIFVLIVFGTTLIQLIFSLITQKASISALEKGNKPKI